MATISPPKDKKPEIKIAPPNVEDDDEGIDPPKKREHKHRHRHHQITNPANIIAPLPNPQYLEKPPHIETTRKVEPERKLELIPQILETTWKGPWSVEQKGNLILSNHDDIAYVTLDCEKIEAICDVDEKTITNSRCLPEKFRPKRKIKIPLVIIENNNPLFKDRLSFCEIDTEGFINVYNVYRNKFTFPKGNNCGFYCITLTYSLK